MVDVLCVVITTLLGQENNIGLLYLLRCSPTASFFYSFLLTSYCWALLFDLEDSFLVARVIKEVVSSYTAEEPVAIDLLYLHKPSSYYILPI